MKILFCFAGGYIFCLSMFIVWIKFIDNEFIDSSSKKFGIAWIASSVITWIYIYWRWL